MTKEEKSNIVEELAQKFADNSFFYIADASGLTVAQINKFRGVCYDNGVEYKVFKNTLIQKALNNLGGDYSAFEEAGVLKGMSGIMFSKEVSNAPAKIIEEYRKKSGSTSPILKAASIDSDLFIGDDQLSMLSSLKSKDELIGEVIGLLQSPAKNVISALMSGGAKIAGVLKTLEERGN